MARLAPERRDILATPFSSRLWNPIFSAAWRYQCLDLFFCNTIREVHWLVEPHFCSLIWVFANVVLCCILHSMASHRPNRPQTTTAVDDQRDVCRHDCPDRFDIRGSKASWNTIFPFLCYWRSSNVIHLRRCIHHWLPGYSMGVPF